MKRSTQIRLEMLGNRVLWAWHRLMVKIADLLLALCDKLIEFLSAWAEEK